MTGVNDFSPPRHLPYVLEAANRRMQLDLAAIMTGQFPELRGSHFRILAMIPATGARPSALADIAQVTRPALGELVRHLEEHGFVSQAPDSSDGRAVIVELTALGVRAAERVAAAIAELRRQWAQEVGAKRLDAVLDTLAELTIPRSP